MYPATLLRSVPVRATERETNALHGREVYKRLASHRIAPRRVSRSSPRAVPRRTPAAPPPRVSREGALPTRRERCPSLSNYTCPLLAIASHLSFLSAPTFIFPFPFSFLSLSFFSGLVPVSRSVSRLCSPRQVSSNAIMLELVLAALSFPRRY